MSEGFEQNKHVLTEKLVRNLFNGLNPRNQLHRVMLLISIPKEARPSEDLTLAEQEEVVVHWANTEGPGLVKLAETINHIIQRQYL
jgi:hypothetical protein